MRKTAKDILGDETGMDALQANDENFNKRIILIKKQLEGNDHPIKEIMNAFDVNFFTYYSPLVEMTMRKLQKSSSPSEIKIASDQM